MPISFTCPHCGHRTNVADRFAGQSGPCSACGQPITVPTLGPKSYVPPPRRRSPLGCLLTSVLCVIVMGGFVLMNLMVASSTPNTWDTMRRQECRGNLQQIATAVSLYEADFGCFPPAHTTDADGNPLHSWRTLLLPYLGEQELYDALDLKEPWDSEANRIWHDYPVDVYQCPADPSGSSTDTNYLMIVGEEGVSPGSKSLKAVEVKDGVSTTILLVESAGSGIHWMEPEDLRWEDTDFAINQDGGISSEHEGGAHVMMCDGAVEFLKDVTPPEDIRALATRKAGDKTPEFLEFEEKDFSINR